MTVSATIVFSNDRVLMRAVTEASASAAHYPPEMVRALDKRGLLPPSLLFSVSVATAPVNHCVSRRYYADHPRQQQTIRA